MKLLREITISGFTGDPDYVGNPALPQPPDSEFLQLGLGTNDIEWEMVFVNGNGDVVGPSSGTFDAMAVFRRQYDSKVVYSRGVLQTAVAAGVRQTVYASGQATGGKTKRPGGRFTVRVAGAITSPPAGAVTARIFAQGV
jgi:hypothetical protein